jgi:hypothetical protein
MSVILCHRMWMPLDVWKIQRGVQLFTYSVNRFVAKVHNSVLFRMISDVLGTCHVCSFLFSNEGLVN